MVGWWGGEGLGSEALGLFLGCDLKNHKEQDKVKQ